MSINYFVILSVCIAILSIPVKASAVTYKGDKAYRDYAVGSQQVSAQIKLQVYLPPHAHRHTKLNTQIQEIHLNDSGINSKKSLNIRVKQNFDYDQTIVIRGQDGKEYKQDARDLAIYKNNGQANVNLLEAEIPNHIIKDMRKSGQGTITLDKSFI